VNGEEVVLITLPENRAAGVTPDIRGAHAFRAGVDDPISNAGIGDVLTR
jgi:hypothetical protein